MPLNIRNDRILGLARKLSRARGLSMADAVVAALEEALSRERARAPLGQRLEDIARRLEKAGDPAQARKAAKAEIDALWGAD